MDPAELWRSERKYVAPDFRENPHMAQLGKEKAGVFAFHELDRVLRDDAPRKPYQVRISSFFRLFVCFCFVFVFVHFFFFFFVSLFLTISDP
jgi:hypothetical protein